MSNQPVQYGIEAVQFIHPAILPERVTDFQWLQQFDHAVIFLIGDREWNRNLPIFRVLSAAQYRFQHIAHSGASLLASMTAFPYLAIMVA